MSVSLEEAKSRIALVPRQNLGFFPTPLHRIDRISDELGVSIYLKRDDFTGKNLFGGNKTRKLEFLIGKAKNDGCDYVFTYGATQSNHAMQTAWAAASNGLKAVLYLIAVVEPDENDIKANLLLDKVLGAEVHVISLNEGETFEEADYRAYAAGREHIARLEAEGHKCIDIPIGAADTFGTCGYINGVVELEEQAKNMNISFDYLYHASGSGGTMAGLVAGNKLIGAGMEVHSITAMNPGEDYVAHAVELSNSALEYLGFSERVAPSDYIVDSSFIGPGYECPSDAATEAIKMLAREEGVLLDPVYSGKAFSGMIADIRNGKIPAGSNVCFVHTGGATALFAEKQILGDILS